MVCERPPAAFAAVPLCKGDNKPIPINRAILPLIKGERRRRRRGGRSHADGAPCRLFLLLRTPRLDSMAIPSRRGLAGERQQTKTPIAYVERRRRPALPDHSYQTG